MSFLFKFVLSFPVDKTDFKVNHKNNFCRLQPATLREKYSTADVLMRIFEKFQKNYFLEAPIFEEFQN